jgi:hypothetical protein
MKKLILIAALLTGVLFFYNFSQDKKIYKDGDIIFQATSGETGKAIQLATKSKYNHCGVLFNENGKWMVYEAVQPVKRTSLSDFNSRGAGTVMRLKASTKVLKPEDIEKLKATFKGYEHKNYDDAYNWSDDRIYCSELVYKLYNNALQIQLCQPRKLRDFDLSNPLVKSQLDKKYGNHIPLEEPMVGPGDISASALLEVVK